MPFKVVNKDLSKSHWELNNEKEPNQLYYISNLITRLYMTKTLLSPDRCITEIMREFRTSIFRGLKFFFIEFINVGIPEMNLLSTSESETAH